MSSNRHESVMSHVMDGKSLPWGCMATIGSRSVRPCACLTWTISHGTIPKIDELVYYEHHLFLWLISENDGSCSSTTATHLGSRCSAW